MMNSLQFMRATQAYLTHQMTRKNADDADRSMRIEVSSLLDV